MRSFQRISEAGTVGPPLAVLLCDDIDLLKQSGFRWAPSSGAWQRQRTENARYAAERIIEVVGPAVAPAAQSPSEPAAEPSEVERPANALMDVRSLYDIMPERGWKCTSSTRDGDIFTSRKAVGWRVVAGAGFYAIEKPHPMDASQWHAARQVQLNECIAELQHNFLAWLDELERTGTLKGTLIQKGYDGKVVNEFREGIEEGFF